MVNVSANTVSAFGPEQAPHYLENQRDPEYTELYRGLANRLGPVCSHMCPAEFDELVHDICSMQLKWRKEQSQIHTPRANVRRGL
jgi:hypothetical protein